jgi:GT2 family glycosyltransferase
MKTKKIGDAKKKSIQKWPKVAIIILNWNGWKDTIECLESVFRNTYSNYQVIVVDNGSTDGSIEKIKTWADGKQEVLTPEPNHLLYHLSHPSVKKPIPYIYYNREEVEKGDNFELEEKITKGWQEQRKSNSKELNSTSPYPLIFIQTGENLGFAGGSNVGIKYTLGKDNFEYVWLLNNDTVIESDALFEMAKSIENFIKIGMAEPKIYIYNKPYRLWSAGKKIFPLIGISKRIGAEKIDNKMYNKQEEKNDLNGCALLIRKRLIEEIGNLDEKYFLYFEDTDWALRAKRAQWKLLYNPKAKIWHKSSLGMRSITSYYFTRNRLLLTKKHYWWFLPVVLVYSLRYSFFNHLLKRRWKDLKMCFLGYIDFFRGKFGRKSK